MEGLFHEGSDDEQPFNSNINDQFTQEPTFDNVDSVLGLELNNSNIEGSTLLGENNNDDGSIKKSRRSIAKLTEEMLLSSKGLKYIRTNSHKIRKRLNKSRDDDYKNLTNFLQFYQIWGHNLFPKAKFKDFLTLIEKLGPRRDIKDQRQQWINQDMGINSFDSFDDRVEDDLNINKITEKNDNRNDNDTNNNNDKNNNNDNNNNNNDKNNDNDNNNDDDSTNVITNESTLFVNDNDFSDDDFWSAPISKPVSEPIQQQDQSLSSTKDQIQPSTNPSEYQSSNTTKDKEPTLEDFEEFDKINEDDLEIERRMAEEEQMIDELGW
ncbi:hypothetical protein WICMUC_001377 [Wickerhamomyces mucosus]|uniref:Chromosome segregation in meiosis protein n=1 Tax=Wickerhamomyces mucosus TaxID=1378264 RepID=A0A9P8PUC5_9ASCO|nr:hypothetical protein WICMUC_001377 [Wickerhamomyces mucosus]